MGESSHIEWTNATWNAVTGCTKVSPGCKHCYAERLTIRLRAMGQPHYQNGFKLAVHDDALTLPLRRRRSRRVFVNSMSDLFHRDVPASFIHDVFSVMRQGSWHEFQVLTKRSERLRQLSPSLKWPANVWMGVSVENADYKHRIDDLRATGAKVKCLSLEPLLGPLPGLDLSGIDRVIVGGESGPGARPMQESWVLDLRDQCAATGTPFFFKQWGGVNKKRAGRLLQGQVYNEMPHAAR